MIPWCLSDWSMTDALIALGFTVRQMTYPVDDGRRVVSVEDGTIVAIAPDAWLAEQLHQRETIQRWAVCQ